MTEGEATRHIKQAVFSWRDANSSSQRCERIEPLPAGRVRGDAEPRFTWDVELAMQSPRARIGNIRPCVVRFDAENEPVELIVVARLHTAQESPWIGPERPKRGELRRDNEGGLGGKKARGGSCGA